MRDFLQVVVEQQGMQVGKWDWERLGPIGRLDVSGKRSMRMRRKENRGRVGGRTDHIGGLGRHCHLRCRSDETGIAACREPDQRM